MNKQNSKRTNLMPHMMGQGPLIEKGIFGENTILSISYLTEKEPLLAFLPPGIQPANDPIVTFHYRHSEKVSFLGNGELNLLGVYVPVIYKGKSDQESGVCCPVLWENNTMAIILGREVMGAPKLYGNITNPVNVNGVWRALLSEDGRPLIEMKVWNLKPVDEGALKEMQEQALKRAYIGWKHIPKENGIDTEISHATYYQLPERLNRAWTGEGEVTLFETEPDINYWTDHIMKSLRTLPLIRCISVFMMKSSGEHLIFKGRALG
jgi:acetoacetate decarboxylase